MAQQKRDKVPQGLPEYLDATMEPNAALQFKQDLASLPYAEQVKALQPPMPLQFTGQEKPVQLDTDPAAGDAEYKPEQDTEFGKPYENDAEAKIAQTWLMTLFIPAVTAAFGVEVGKVWAAFLTRRPGDSMETWKYSQGDEVGDAYLNDQMTHLVTRDLLVCTAQVLTSGDPSVNDLVGQLKDGEWVNMPIERMVVEHENIKGMNFGNPATIPGNLAGGVGGGDVLEDKRQVTGYVAVYAEMTPTETKIDFKPAFVFHIVDTVDFLPGDIGAGFEQIFTVPLSRLEASELAYDVPIEVNFAAPDIRADAELPELEGRPKHLFSVLEVAATAKEKGLSAAADLATEKAKTLQDEALAAAGEKARELLAAGSDALAEKIAGKIDEVAGDQIDKAADKVGEWLIGNLFE